MDKQEYKIRLDEIMTLVANEQFVDAVEIADQIDWRKVRSFTTLQKIGELYQINRRYDEAMEIMKMAYGRNQKSRTIMYSLCDIAIDMDDLEAALINLAAYKRMAPNDIKGGLILQYKILEMQNAKTEDKIELLEELNRKDYTEEWAYQLAYLYHRIGLAAECVETCDQLITWFNSGPFVIKAIELKMLHAPLTASQKKIYDSRNDISDQIEAYESDEYTVERAESSVAEEMGKEDFHVKTIDMGKFNTLNLQKALAESMRELMGDDPDMEESPLVSTGELEQRLEEDAYPYNEEEQGYEEAYYPEDDYSYENENYNNEDVYSEDGNYNNGNYENTYPENEYPEEYEEGAYIEDPDYADTENAYTEDAGYENPEDSYDEKLFRGDAIIGDTLDALGINLEDTQKIDVVSRNMRKTEGSRSSENSVNGDMETSVENEVFFDDKTGDIIMDQPPAGTNMPIHMNPLTDDQPAISSGSLSNAGQKAANDVSVPSASVPKEQNMQEVHHKIERKPVNSIFDNVLSQGMDGQISLVVPPEAVVEKQITGQMNLQDVFLEWENVKKRKEEERKAKNNKNIVEQTGKIFADFEATSKTGPLAKIEEETKIFANKFKNTEIELRSIDALEAPAAKGLIWDEVNAAIEADRQQEQGGSDAALAGEEVLEGLAGAAEAAVDLAAVAASNVAGDIASGAVATAGVLETMGAEAVADAAMVAADAVLEPVSYGGTAGYSEEESAEGYPEDAASYSTEEYTGDYQDNYPGENADYTAEELQVMAEYDEGELSAYGQAASDILNDGSEEVYEEPVETAEAAVTEESVKTGESVNEQVLDTSQINNIGNVLEAEADKVGADTAEEDNDSYNENDEHYLTAEEKSLFSDFMYSKKMSGQILDAIDQISLAPYVGNVIITGDSGTGVIELAKTMIKEIQMIDSNFSASRVAKISGDKMNRKDLAAMFEQLSNGALIVEKAGTMTKDTLENMTRILESCQEGIIIILTDTKKDMEKLIKKYDLITGYFNARIDIKPMNDNALVDYARKYAYNREYKIDEERAVLALHRRINDLQIGEHNVTVREIEDIIDEAIDRSKRLRLSTYIDILVGKRYDYEDMIILKEKDFD